MIFHKHTILSFFLPAGLTLLLPFVLVYFYLLPRQYENLVQQKREIIQGVVDNAWKTIDFEYKQFKQGRISEQEAKRTLYQIVEYLRWGPDEANYLYLFTGDGLLLAHPYSPDLIGKNLKEVRDGKNRSLGRLLLEAANRPDHPFVVYYWYKPGDRKIMLRKLNCVRYFKPWNWVVGGGVYFEDIDQQNQQQKLGTIVFFGVMSIIIGILLIIIVKRGLKEEVLRTERENELRASEQKFRDIYDNTTAFVGLLDVEGRVLDINRTAVEFLHIHTDVIIGLYFWDTPWWTHDSEQREKLRRAYDNAVQYKQAQRFDTSHVAPGGREILVDFSLKPLFDENREIRNFIVQGVDVTEQRRTEENLRQSQKLDAIGHLAGGIAHDFNNILEGILSCADLISLEVKKSPRLVRYTDLIINSAENAGKLTNKLLTFSRKEAIVSTIIDAHECINDALDILERTINKNIRIIRKLDAHHSTMVGEPVQIQNSIINLGINASHAMPNGGDLIVYTTNINLDEATCRSMPFELEPGDYINIDVKDTGIGIPRKFLERIFEPFFTTKGIGEGTGLGLATVYGIVKDHHGAITVESEEGIGTRFIMFFPVEHVKVSSTKRIVPEELYGEGRILVIDDEEIIRTTAMGLLTKLGYEVFLAKDGEQGIQIYRQHQNEIDLVIMDMVMPGMSGSMCFQHIREINPDVRVILSSGFSQEDRIEDLKREGIKAVIEKPYRFQQLARIIKGILSDKNE